VAKVREQIHKLFLRLLNFTPELLANIQQEAKLRNTTFDALVRTAVEKHLRDLKLAREQQEAELGNYARLLLRAHFAEDRNEFLSDYGIRAVGSQFDRH
jgi:hypothetical protein